MTRASATAWLMPKTIELMASFRVAPAPRRPTCSTGLPIDSSTGRTASTEASSPAAMIIRVRASAAAVLPDTGASTIAAPVASTSAPSRSMRVGPTVLMSTAIFPAPSPASRPDSPRYTASSASPSASIVTATSARSARARGESTTSPPVAAATSSALDRVRL